MATTFMLLKADPYNTKQSAEAYITEDRFYDGKNAVYLVPEQSLAEAQNKIARQEGFPAGILRINGYAGCGKTLFAHYLIRSYGVKEHFCYEFDQGEGENYQIRTVKDRLVDKFSHELSSLIVKQSPVIQTFQFISNKLNCERQVKDCVNRLFSEKNKKFHIAMNNSGKVPEDIEKLVKDGIIFAYGAAGVTESDSLVFLLILDYLLRVALSQEEVQVGGKKIVFCLLDNIDNLHREAVVELYCALVGVVKTIRQRNNALEDLLGVAGPCQFIYLFPTREVTKRKLKDGLLKRVNSETLDSPGIMDWCKLALNSDAHGMIVQKRIGYWKTQMNVVSITAAQQKEMSQAKALICTKFAQGSFSSLYNNNYSRCVNRILDFYTLYPTLAKECAHYLFPRSRATLPPEVKSAAAFAQRGTFLRALLEILKSEAAYASPTDLHSQNHFRNSSKLGLVALDPYDVEHGYRVSLSRLVLTYLESKEDKVAYLSELLDFFSSYEPEEVCRCVYALSENIRDKWRRLVMFNSNIPIEIEDLYVQSRQRDIPQMKDTEIQICVAGEEYLNVIVPSFEFFLSRLDRNDNLKRNPPLFSEDSMKHGKWRQSISDVLRAVENCAEHLYYYDISMIDKFLKRGKLDAIACMFVSSKDLSDRNVKQSHLSRIVFSHVSYVEAFRRYYLWYWSTIVPVERQKPLTDLINDNKRIIAYLIRYLTLFSREWIDNRSKYVRLLENPYLTYDYVATAYYLHDCKSVNVLLPEKRKSYLIDGLHEGFRRQESAQSGLLDIILEIHQKGYAKETFFTPIEINNHAKGELI